MFNFGFEFKFMSMLCSGRSFTRSSARSFARGVILLPAAMGLIACGKSNKSSDAAIPTDIPFDEKSLPAMTTAEFAQAKSVARATGEAVAPQSQVLIKQGETDADRRERNEKFTRLRPQVQQLVQAWQQDCAPNPQKSGERLEGVPRVGQVYRTTESNTTSGANCPIEFSERTDTALTVTQFTQTPVSLGMNLSASGGAHGVYRNSGQAQEMGAVSFDLSFSMTGRFERSGESYLSYARLQGTGRMESVGFGPIHVDMINQSLNRLNNEKSLTTYRFTQGGKTFVFTQYVIQTNNEMPQPRFFIGNRELTQEEVLAMGEFPFNVNQNTVIGTTPKRW